MGWRTRDDRGLVATEAGLLYGGVALIFVPILFLLGTVVHDVFDNAGQKLPGGSGSAQQPGPDPGDPAVVATRSLEADLASRLDDSRGRPTVGCDTLPAPAPTDGTTNCRAVYPNGDRVQVVVTWSGGTYTVS